MTTELETQAPIPEAMLETIVSSGINLYEMSSDPLPAVGSVVVIGYGYRRETLRVTTIIKIDKSGVITTREGTRFSTTCSGIISTRKVVDRYWSMYNLEDHYRRALERIERNRIDELRSRHSNLQHKVAQLRSVEDAETIDQLLKILEGEP